MKISCTWFAGSLKNIYQSSEGEKKSLKWCRKGTEAFLSYKCVTIKFYFLKTKIMFVGRAYPCGVTFCFCYT